MSKKDYILILLIVIIASVGLLASSGALNKNNEQIIQLKSLNPPEIKILGENDLGTVIKSGPYGNPDSQSKIAIIVGVHPLEVNSHRAMTASLYSLSKSLNCSYYIYSIHVSKDRYSYNDGRMNGQLLAKYAVSDIKKSNFDLVVDVHSNRGHYKQKRFICVPIKDNKSKLMASSIENKISWLVYYVPPKDKGPSSPNFVTVPLIQSGTPAVVYETYAYESYDLTVKHASEIISAIDKLNLKK